MGVRASRLFGLAIVAACGHQFDTSVQPDPIDGTVTPSDAGDAAAPSKEASIGDDDDDDDDDGGVDSSAPDAATDTDTDADAGAVESCTSFNEPFTKPWLATTVGWNPPPSAPYFNVADGPPSTHAELQASSVGSPTSTILTHDVLPDCRAHLRVNVAISEDVANTGDVTVVRFKTDFIDLDIVRISTGALNAVYAGTSRAIGQLNAGVAYTLDIDFPANVVGDGVTLPILLNGAPAAQPLTLANGPSKITQIQLGVVKIVSSEAITATVDLDDVVLNP